MQCEIFLCTDPVSHAIRVLTPLTNVAACKAPWTVYVCTGHANGEKHVSGIIVSRMAVNFA